MTEARTPARRVQDIDWRAWRPRDRATLLFVRSADRLLLIQKRRGFGAGKVNAPGGKLEPGETALEAAVHEVEEEVGVTPLEPRHHGELRFQFTDGYSLHASVFVAPAYRGSPRATPEADPFWVPVTAIPFERMWADDRLWLPPVLDGHWVDGYFVFDGDALLDHHLQQRPMRPGP